MTSPQSETKCKNRPFLFEKYGKWTILTKSEIFPTLELNLEWFGHFKESRGPRTPDGSESHVLFNDLRSKSVFLNEKM